MGMATLGKETLAWSGDMSGRTVLVVVLLLVVAGVSGRWYMLWRVGENEKVIASQVESDGGVCKYHNGRVTQVSFTGQQVSKATIERLADFSMLRRLVLVDCPLETEALQQLTSLPLREFVLMDAQITDKDLSALRQLRELEYLHLSGANITEAGLKHVAQIRTLLRLDLESLKISDEGLLQLKSLLLLRDFHLAECEVSPAALTDLQREIPLTDIFVDLKRH